MTNGPADTGHGLDPSACADRARELSNRSLVLGEQNHADEALTCAGEAVMHYRHLAAEDPGYRRVLAKALSNWAVALDRLDRYDEAQAALTEAVAIHRACADDGPGRQDLAIALTNLALNLTQQRESEQAVTPAWEAVALLRGLLQTGEGDEDTVNHLGAALTNWSNALRAAGRGDEASEKLAEALQVAREHLDPADPGSLVRHAQLLHNLGMDRADQGSIDEAVALLSEAESLLTTAAEAEPGYRWMAAQTGYELGVRLAEAQRAEPACDAFDRVVRWRRKLVADDPDRYVLDLARALRNLSGTHESLADDADRPGDREAHLEAAMTAQAEAVMVMRDLSGHEPRRRAEFTETLLEYAVLLDAADRPADAAAARAEAEGGP
ncbi:tetratricopeptide repeat protein [Actinoplanes sp. KI2]|uniref:tetratricopeptide repeat protein n=1 Tax=Actinoplanes sp. KI2 TaxID=2983315 RepID=UPI0021D6069A|nr:tetratricopeptide repeat protein [Actinoplanes sp. KI2]MCU7728877.1 tetratricopeptide repeat protein [Actinoplanes sp. KI2]